MIHAAPFVDLSTRSAVSLARCFPFILHIRLFLYSSTFISVSSRDPFFLFRFELNSYSLERYFFFSLHVKVWKVGRASSNFFAKKKKISRRKKLKILLREFGKRNRKNGAIEVTFWFISIDCRSFLKRPLKAVQMLWMGSPTHWPTFFPTETTRTTYFQESLVPPVSDRSVRRANKETRRMKIILFFTRWYLENRKTYKNNSKGVSKCKVQRF